MKDLFSRDYEVVSLDEWVKMHHNEEDMREVFLNMDRALKYIHDHGYCIYTFHPSEIEVLENMSDHINFKKLMELPADMIQRKNIIREDIFNSTLIQLSFYGGINSDRLFYFTPDFVRENFDKFVQFLPNEDVPYYRGVVQRGASVYFCEYALEKRNRDLTQLEKELGDVDDKSVIKTTNMDDIDITNEKINDTIYTKINGLRDAAFVNMLLVPTISLVVILLFGLLAWFMSLN